MITYPPFATHFETQSWCLPRVLEHHARTIGERPFLQWTHEQPALTFAQVNAAVNRLAHGLLQRGVRKNDRIVVLLPNCLDYILIWFAANKIGAVEAPINIAYKGGFLEHQVNISGADTIVVAEEFLDQVEASMPGMQAIKRVIVWSRDGVSLRKLPVFAARAVLRFGELGIDNESDPGIDVTPRDLAAILFTSGTTGPSKGVLMPHAQLYFFSEQDVQMVGLTGQDTYMTGFPLFHGNAQFLTVYPCLIVGARCVLYERFSASEWLTRIRESGATVTNFLGATLAFVLAQPATAQDRDHRLTRIYAAPTPHEMVPAIRQRFGDIDFVEGFGQTEICLPFMTPSRTPRPSNSCGVLVDQWFDVRLVDPETDEEVPVGTVGELIVRPKQPWILNQGYADMPEKSLEAFRNLWFHTGDGLRRDADGWYFFTDRVKDALRRRGENISSFEVEEPIRGHPSVADVAVIAVPADQQGGEDEVKACVVLKPAATLAAAELIAWCDDRIPYFAVPRYIEFVDDLPRTPSEKVQKSVLRAAGLTVRTWDRLAAGCLLKEEIAKNARRR